MKKLLCTLVATSLIFGVNQAATAEGTTTPVAVDTGFKDVAPNSPYAVYIHDLKSRNIVVGYAGNFNPEQQLTRAEFATMLVRSFGIPQSADAVRFVDSRKHWGEKFIESAARAGLVSGTSSSTFEPDVSLRRQEAAQMVWNYLSRNEVAAKDKELQVDAEAWAKVAVQNVLSYQLYGPEVKDNKYNSTDAMTRQEVAALFSQALKIPTPKRVVVNPTTNADSLIKNVDGTKSLGNIEMPKSIAGWQEEASLKRYMGLLGDVKMVFSGDEVEIRLPATGSGSLLWIVDDANNNKWEGTTSKTLRFAATRGVGISLNDYEKGRTLARTSLLFQNGKWQVRYPMD